MSALTDFSMKWPRASSRGLRRSASFSHHQGQRSSLSLAIHNPSNWRTSGSGPQFPEVGNLVRCPLPKLLRFQAVFLKSSAANSSGGQWSYSRKNGEAPASGPAGDSRLPPVLGVAAW